MKKQKYNNKKTIVDGITFDSKLEARRYQELKLMEKAGIIKDLILQPEYELTPSFKKNGATYRKSTYRADFGYFDVKLGKTILEDSKGVLTPVYRLKKKMFEHKYSELEIKEVKR